MYNREVLNQKISENKQRINELEQENTRLEIECLQICDDEQWYDEKDEVICHREGRKKIKETVRVGRVYWKEFFQDESKPKGEGVTIERSRIVRENGVWYL